MLDDEHRDARIYYCACDISNKDSRKILLDYIENRPDNINLLINNAGVSRFDLLKNQSEGAISKQLQVNALYPLLFTRQFLRYFDKHSIAGQIINIGSTFGNIAYPGFTPYSASEFALHGASEALSKEYADCNIKIRYFSPRATQTELNTDSVVKMNRDLKVDMDTPEHVAEEFMRFLSSNKQSQCLG